MSDWGLRLTLTGSPAYNVAPFENGVLRLTRGNPVTDAAGATWHADYLADLQPPRERVDIAPGGNLSQVGQCQALLLSELVEGAEAAGAIFPGALLEAFDGIEAGFAPSPDWTGTVLDVARSGRLSALLAGSPTASRHKASLPLREASLEEFPFARPVDAGKAIPLVFGDNENVPALGVDCAIRGPFDPATGTQDAAGLNRAGGVFALAAYSDLATESPTINLSALAAVADYDDDDGLWIKIAQGADNAQVLGLILPGGNEDVYVEIVVGHGAGQVRRARLESMEYNHTRSGNDKCRAKFALSAPFSPGPYKSTGDRSWVICYRRSLDFIGADAPVQGQSLTFPVPALFQVKDGERIPLPTASIAPATVQGLPGYRIDGAALTRADALNGLVYVPLYGAEFLRWQRGDELDHFVQAGSVDRLINRDLTTGFGITTSNSTTAFWTNAIARLRIPPLDAFGVKSFEKAYLGCRWNYTNPSGSPGVDISASIKTPLLDEIANIVVVHNTQWSPYTGRGEEFFNSLPRSGPWTAGTPANDYDWIRHRKEIPGLTPDNWSLATFLHLQIGGHSFLAGSTLRVMEIGIFLETKTDLERQRLYHDVRGGRISSGRVLPAGAPIIAPAAALAEYYERDLGIPPEQIDFAAAQEVTAQHLALSGASSVAEVPFRLTHLDSGPSDALTVQICREWNIIASQTPSGVETFRHLLARVHTTEYDAAIHHDDLLKGTLAGWKPSDLLDMYNEWDILWDWTEPTGYRKSGRVTLGAVEEFPPSNGAWRQLVSVFGDWGLALQAWAICDESRRRWGLVRRGKLQYRTISSNAALESVLLPRNGLGLLEWVANRKREYSGQVARNHPVCQLPKGSRILLQHPRFTRSAIRYGTLVERQPLYAAKGFAVTVLCDPPKSSVQGELYDTLDLADEILDTLDPADDLEDRV